jgi:hypothetical protein
VQSQSPGSIPQATGPADYQIDTPVTVTSQSTAPNGPLFAQLEGPPLDPVMDALQNMGRVPTQLEEQLSRPFYKSEIGVPPEDLDQDWTFRDALDNFGTWLEWLIGSGPAPVLVTPYCTSSPRSQVCMG